MILSTVLVIQCFCALLTSALENATEAPSHQVTAVHSNIHIYLQGHLGSQGVPELANETTKVQIPGVNHPDITSFYPFQFIFPQSMQFNVETRPDEKTEIKSMPKSPPTSNSCKCRENIKNSELCIDPNIDAMFSDSCDIYVFKGERFWTLNDYGIITSCARFISEYWPNAPSNIDAAFYDESTKATFFFRESQYWKYVQNQLLDGYPKLIADGFPGVPDYIGAAYVWKENSMIYFVKGSQYWRREVDERPSQRDKGPDPISADYAWPGMPSNIDALVQFPDGFTYFFKGDQYYRFELSQVSSGVEPSYPRPTTAWWFGCKNRL